MKKVVLPVYWHTTETSKLEDLSLDTNLEDYVTRKVTFYNIVAVSDFVENGEVKGSRIHVPGDSFLCPLSRVALEALIEEAFRTTY